MRSIRNIVVKKTMPVFLIFLMVTSCTNLSNTSNYNADSKSNVNWSHIDKIDINEINSDLVNGKPTVDIGIYQHYLHHKYFECNYSDGIIPLDKWFGSFHDGSEEADEAMKARA